MASFGKIDPFAYALLKSDERTKIKDFCQEIDKKPDDEAKVEFWEQWQSGLLTEQAGLELLAAAVHGVVGQYSGDERFLALAKAGSKCFQQLKKTSEIWGLDKIEHYDWGYKGINFCNNLRAAAYKVRDWEEASPKLSQIVWRRYNQHRRRHVEESVNPICSDDLWNLAQWAGKGSYVKRHDKERVPLPYKKLTRRELDGSGLGFDKYGLIVHASYAVAAGEETDEATSEPETTGEVGLRRSVDAPNAPVEGTPPERTRLPTRRPEAPCHTTAPGGTSDSVETRVLRPRTIPTYREIGDSSRPSTTSRGEIRASKRPRIDPETEPPTHDRVGDEECLQQMRLGWAQTRVVPDSHGEANYELIRTLLRLSKPPDGTEARFLSGPQAKETWRLRIVTVCQLREKTKSRLFTHQTLSPVESTILNSMLFGGTVPRTWKVIV